MDTRLAISFAALLMLCICAILGLLHNGLPHDVKPSATLWRIGTLLCSCATILMIAHGILSIPVVSVVGNTLAVLALALYLLAINRFVQLPDHWMIAVPAVTSTIISMLLNLAWRDLTLRVITLSLIAAVMLLSIAWVLWRHKERSAVTTSRRVMIGLSLSIGMLALYRAISAIFVPYVGITILDEANNATSRVLTVLLAVYPILGTTVFLAMCLERARNQVLIAAATDYLTGLPNRRSIAQRGEQMFSSTDIATRQMCVALIDIDHFKRINDAYGHDIGDIALKHVADVLRQASPQSALVGRQGGEEFVVVFDESNQDSILPALEAMRQSVEQHPIDMNALLALNDKGANSLLEAVAMYKEQLPPYIKLTVSVGISCKSGVDQSFSNLLTRADKALYAAKAAGRNQVQMA